MWGIWAALLVAASLNDLRWRRLPNGLLVASGVLALGFQGARMWGDPLVLAVASAPLGPALWGVLPHPAVCTGSALVFLGAASALELACRHRNISLMGLGDIKLLACLAAAAGPLVGFLGGLLGCGAGGMVALIGKKTHFAAGPWICAGCGLVWWWATEAGLR